MGLFSETSIGTFQENNHMKLNENVNKIITLDAEWLMLLVYKFESEYYNSLSFTINNACYKKGDRIYQLYSLIEDQEKISIRETSVYKIISKKL